MKNYFLLSLTALVCLLLLTACHDRRHTLKELDVFVENVEKNAPQYSDADWERSDAEYDALIKEIDKYDYSIEETRQIGKLKGEYAGIKVKYKGEKFLERIDKAIEEAMGKIEGFKDGFIGQVEPQVVDKSSGQKSP